MNKRKTDRYATTKKITISYSTEMSDDYFNNYCMKHRLNRNEAVKQIKYAAIKAAEDEIDYQLTEVWDVKIYDNGE